ncbi:hypothetical protein F6A46_12225 [Tenacibaculum finnmarkense genomovar ulcerans]|uniref:hypothetical protein n=1 Tax=Tenacibaculum finnmarkense TaxID=2781243 RepID=UPI00187B8873|nr:hypothetical protein [Tenacibaculum finnmarkense]MBE7688986.1 hypothetical protein [Tenacibaculum finnmarkense genomovar ulcerans]
MKNSIFYIIILITNLISAQEKSIDDYVSNIWNTEHTSSVKSIFIEHLEFYRNKESRIDTSRITNKVFYDKKNNLIKRNDYSKDLKEPTQIIYYDTLNRVSKIIRKHKGEITEVFKQYFSSNSKYPDSLNIFEKGIKTQYINHFSHTLLTKKEFFRNNTLRHYNLYKYNSDNQLTKKLFINTKNGFGVILDKSFTGYKSEKHLNANDSTIYKYQKKIDTLIIKKYRYNKLDKIIKKIKNKNLEIVIEDDFWNGKLNSRFSNYKWKDSIKTEYLRFNKKLEVDEYKNITTSKDKIIKRWKNSMTNERPENVEIKTIQTKYDKFNNWINKIYILDGLIEKEINRKIEYNWH